MTRIFLAAASLLIAAQLTAVGAIVQKNRKKTEPPPASSAYVCIALIGSKTEVVAGEWITAYASTTDPDGEEYRFVWRSTAGELYPQGDRAQLDTTDLEPGEYEIEVEISDGTNPPCKCTAWKFRIIAPR